MSFVAWLACLLPAAWIPRLGRSLGWLAFSVLRVRRGVTLENLRRSSLDLSAPKRRALGRQIYNHLCTGALEFLRLGLLTPGRAREFMGPDTLARLDDLRQGSGVLVLTAHLGHWDMLACCAALSGLPLNVVTRQIKASWLNGHWMRQREACGVRLLAEGSATAVLRALRNNELVALVLDQHQPGGLVLPFLGRPAATNAALARIALSRGAPVVPAFFIRCKDGYKLELGEPIDLARTGDQGADVLENTGRFLQVLERQICRQPEQWLWLHRRWKVPPKKNGDSDQ